MITILKLKDGSFIVCKTGEPGKEEYYTEAVMLVVQQNGGMLVSLAYPLTKDAPVDILKSRLESEVLLDNVEDLMDNFDQLKSQYENFISKNKTGLITNVSNVKLK
jgi:hypothetical protein